ncbi:MAG: RsmD family RNA methyltransferase [Limibacillus sp.]
MRIVGGSLKGKRLEAPEGGQLRPTSDRARESLFNLLTQGRVAREAAGGGNPLIGARLLDGFAGTGALGIEALSRGATEAFFMEKDAGALKLLRGNLKHCGLERQGRVVPAVVANPPTAERACDIVLLDPPYMRPEREPGAAGGFHSSGGAALRQGQAVILALRPGLIRDSTAPSCSYDD